MYAVFQSGGKQHRVSEGQTIRLEKLEVATGETIEFDTVMMVADGDNIQIGAPILEGVKVKAEVV
ncbi:50S ribosomal protein L21, partial [Proteus mirabilis]